MTSKLAVVLLVGIFITGALYVTGYLPPLLHPLSIGGPFDFYITMPSSIQVAPGSSVSVPVVFICDATPSQEILITVNDCPNGVSCVMSQNELVPAVVMGTTAYLIVTASTTAATGSYSISVNAVASDNSISYGAASLLIVGSAVPEFPVSVFLLPFVLFGSIFLLRARTFCRKRKTLTS